MKELLFFSRHNPTYEQLQLAIEAGYHLVWKGDLPAFGFETLLNHNIGTWRDPVWKKTASWVKGTHGVDMDWNKDNYVAVVHPMLALNFSDYACVKKICIFENANRDGEFKAVALHEWENTSDINDDVPF